MKRTSRGVFDKETLRDIGERIRAARGDATQDEFAKKIGVGRTVLANYEAGRRLPESVTLEKISDHSHRSVNFILTGFEAEKDPFDVDTAYAGTPFDYGYAAALFVYDQMRESFADKSSQDRLVLWGSILPKLAEHLDDVIGRNVAINDTDYDTELTGLIDELQASERAAILELMLTVNAGRPPR